MKKWLKIVLAIMVTVLAVFSWTLLADYYPNQEYDRINRNLTTVLDEHDQVIGRYENAKLLRDESGAYYAVFDLTYDYRKDRHDKLRERLSKLPKESPVLPELEPSEYSIGMIKLRNRFFDFGKTHVYPGFVALSGNSRSDIAYNYAVFNHQPVFFGKILDESVFKIEIYLDNILVKTFMKATDEHGINSGNFFLIELDKNSFKDSQPGGRVRVICYNSEGEIVRWE